MTPFALSRAQQDALEEIRTACSSNYRGNPQVVVVRGFSGVGKSALVDAIQEEFQEQGHLILSPEKLRFAPEAVNHMNHEGQIIVAAGFYDAAGIQDSLRAIADPVSYEFYTVDWNHILKRQVCFINLKGMNADEMRTYAAARNSKSLGLDELIECSVGLPGLANQLMDIPHLDLELGRRLSALHLWNNLRSVWGDTKYFGKFLHIDLAPETKAMFEKGFHPNYNVKEKHIYDRLLHLRSSHFRDQITEDVTFVAPQSIGIYTESLGKSFTGISIYIPRLSDKEFNAVAALMGYQGENYTFTGKTPRWYLFDVDQKELSIYGKIKHREFGMVQWEPMSKMSLRNWRVQAITYDRGITTDLIPFPQKFTDNSFIVYVNDHGGVNKQPLNLGWMLESFLQQRGIAYLAHNSMCGKSYVFNPSLGELQCLEKETLTKISDLSKVVEKEIPYEY